MEKEKTKLKREWVKTAAIVFLSILLVLTFFSNTIMNHSLPEVAAENISSGTIQARIRGSGTVIANEAYEVTLKQSREVESVLVRVGDHVVPGDVLFKLGSLESAELKQAQQTLRDMEVAYRQHLLSQGNADSALQREIQELKSTYEKALNTYYLYASDEPEQAAAMLHTAEQELSDKERVAAERNLQVSQAEQEVAKAVAAEEVRINRLNELKTEIANHQMKIDSLRAAMDILDKDRGLYQELYFLMEQTAVRNRGEQTLESQMEHYANHPDELQKDAAIEPEKAADCVKAYHILSADLDAITGQLNWDSEAAAPSEQEMTSQEQIFDPNLLFEEKYDVVSVRVDKEITIMEQNIALAGQEKEVLEEKLKDLTQQQDRLNDLKEMAQNASDDVEAQKQVVSSRQAAAEAAQTVLNAKDALDDKIFESTQENPDDLSMESERLKIKEQEALITKLSEDADGAEITSKVSGVVSQILVSAGATAQADTPVAVITVEDRGFLLKIPVSNEQARKVTIGDPAEVTNFYWGNITAVLENITADPDSQGKGKLLLFRISGDGVESGTNLSLAIGQKSASYDCLIPNSAVRTDSNGTFVLVIEAKSSPLGNRYVATRADIKVLASDDTRSAVAGLAYGDFVITTSTMPLEAGDQVRLVDNT